MLNSQLKSKPLDYYKIDRPALIEIDGGITIHVDNNNNVTIDGHDKVKIRSNGEMDLDAKTINMRADGLNLDIDGDIYMGSSNSIFQQAPRLDFNFYKDKSGYRDKK